MRRQHAGGDAEHLEHVGVPRRPVGGEQAGDGRVGVVGDVQLAARQRPRQPACRRCRSRGRGRGRPATWSSSQASLVADWFGASARSCSALAMMHSPTVRRSCQPSAGPIGSPVARSQTTVLARWLVMPTAVIGSSTASVTSAAASSDERARARRRRTRRGRGTASTAGTAGAAIAAIARRSSTTRGPHARRPDVEDEDRGHRARSPRAARRGCAGAGRAGRRRARRRARR